MTEPKTWECWAYVSPSGWVHADSRKDGLKIWNDMLAGWATDEEIQAAKQRGARVIRVRIEEINDAVDR